MERNGGGGEGRPEPGEDKCPVWFWISRRTQSKLRIASKNSFWVAKLQVQFSRIELWSFSTNLHTFTKRADFPSTVIRRFKKTLEKWRLPELRRGGISLPKLFHSIRWNSLRISTRKMHNKRKRFSGRCIQNKSADLSNFSKRNGSPATLANIRSLHIRQRAETEPSWRRRIHSTVHIHWWSTHCVCLTDFCVVFIIRYHTPICRTWKLSLPEQVKTSKYVSF